MNEKRIFRVALAGSLLLHVLLAAGTWNWDLKPDLSQAFAEEATEVELFLEPDDPVTDPDREMPQAFTAIPDRQASEEPPEDPDYLSNRHSIAADNKLGGDSDAPSADEEWISEQVAIQKDEQSGAEGTENANQPLPEAESATSPEETGEAGKDQELSLIHI